MAMIQWSDSLSVNVVEIDEQHKKLIGMLNELNAAMLQGKGRDVLGPILDGLAVYAGTHFQTEERYFARFGYPEANTHQKAHANFVAKVIDFQKGFDADRSGLSVDVLLFMSDWLQNHICVVDKRYSSFFNAKGLM